MSKKIIVKIKGLHCRACELLNEQNLRTLPEVKDVNIDHKTGLAEIYYDQSEPERSAISKALAEGYELEPEEKNNHEHKQPKDSDDTKNKHESTAGQDCALPDKSPQKTNWQLIIPLFILLYWLAGRLSSGDAGGMISGEFSLPLAALIGLAAGFSTCLALVGGLVFGLATNHAKNNPQATRLQKFEPHILFNLGRIAGFFVLGGLLGALGSAFKISSLFNGFLTVFVGLVILFLGLKLLNISPALSKWELALPKSLGRKIKAKNPGLLGALTFFLPCGFTQAMQIYALGSGDFLSGGLIMALFALGTAPGLLSIGGLVALIKQKQSGLFFKISGLILVLFAFFNLQNGWRLIQVSLVASSLSGAEQTNNLGAKSEQDGDFQIVRMTESNRGYTPNRVEIIKDKPVRWIIDAQAPYSCAAYLIVPSLGIERQLKKGENIIEFTPTKVGTIPFSCSMGMYNGAFHVVE